MTGTAAPLAALAVALLLMLAEAQRSRANERVLRAAGATEPAGDVYGLMLWSYPGAFVAMALAAAWMDVGRLSVAGAAVFLAAKALKYWAISTLGTRWTFRVLVPPESARVTTGPYRWISHPNYVAVAGELAGFALLVHAGWIGLAATLWFVLLMWLRMKVEERALYSA
ncbi:MAG: isoprenylcysteine carboxylmethyltransferase family protein [Vicinamibacterales bacterium]